MTRRSAPATALAVSCGLAGALVFHVVGAAVPTQCFVVQAATVHDARTNLTWQQLLDPIQSDPTSYCATLVLNGGGWRVPRLRELETIVDYGRSNPAIDPVAFPQTPSENFWTSSPHPFTSGTGYVDFSTGTGGVASVMHGPWRVRCVR
jgi:hypothetical protein